MFRAALAQLVEHIIRNDGVACSSHASGTSKIKHLALDNLSLKNPTHHILTNANAIHTAASAGHKRKNFLPERSKDCAEGGGKEANKHNRPHSPFSPAIEIRYWFLNFFKPGVDALNHALYIVKRPVGFLLLFVLLLTILPRLLLIRNNQIKFPLNPPYRSLLPRFCHAFHPHSFAPFSL